jgi:hypothetical protein
VAAPIIFVSLPGFDTAVKTPAHGSALILLVSFQLVEYGHWAQTQDWQHGFVLSGAKSGANTLPEKIHYAFISCSTAAPRGNIIGF